MKSATIAIQIRFKAFLLAKQQRRDFLALRSAVITIQQRFRANKEAKVQRKHFLTMKSATIVIQMRFKAFLLAKQQRRNFLALRSAAIKIQQRFKANKEAKVQKNLFVPMKIEFKEKQHTRKMLEESFVTIQNNAAVRIQAAWRAYLVRKTVKIPKPPKTSEQSTDNQQPISVRGQHYFNVLANYKKYTCYAVQNTLANIDKITVLSASQCEFFVRNGAVKLLYEILSSSNKGVGVQKYLELALSILLNLYRAPTTTEIVWKETREVNGIYHIFSLMMRFKREKSSTVFCKACSVIWLFAQDSVKAEEMLKTPKVQELYKYIVKSMPKKELPGTSCNRKKSEKSCLLTMKSKSAMKYPATRLNLGGYFDDIRSFEDENFALDAIIEKLGRFLKE